MYVDTASAGAGAERSILDLGGLTLQQVDKLLGRVVREAEIMRLGLEGPRP